MLKRWSLFFATWYEKKCLSRYYLTIKELPVSKWAEMDKIGLKAITKHGNPDKFAPKAYQIIQDEIIDAFGINETYQKILKLKIKIAILKAEIALTDDRTRLIFIERAEQKIQELQEDQPQNDIYEAIFHIQRHLPYKINHSTYTVWEFLNDSKQLSSMLKRHTNGAI